jgi:hypothetical protein
MQNEKKDVEKSFESAQTTVDEVIAERAPQPLTGIAVRTRLAAGRKAGGCSSPLTTG